MLGEVQRRNNFAYTFGLVPVADVYFHEPHRGLGRHGNRDSLVVFAVVVILIHCYHGYTASGGPAGVGVAVGRAVRTSIVAINVIDLFLSMAIWGTTTTVRLAG